MPMQKEIEILFEKVNSAAVKSGRKLSDITIVAATKLQSIDTVRLLADFGIVIAGENKVQEFLSKYQPIDGLEWQFIGNLQTNKVKYLVDKVALIQSVDNYGLAAEIDKRCRSIGKVMPILIEVNVGREEQKGGVLPECLNELIEQISSLPSVKICGLMSVMPKDAGIELYQQINSIYKDVCNRYSQLDWQYLSVGMSGDFEIAIENGANMIRIGQSIFGRREYK